MMMYKNLKKYAAIPAALSLLVFTVGCGSDNKEQTKAPAEKYCIPPELKSKVRYEDIKLATENDKVALTGKVEYNPEKLYRFVPLLDGIVDKVHVSLGDQVQKGQIILEIRSTELSSLNAEQKTAMAQLRTAERQLSAAQDMYKSAIISEKDLIEAEKDVEVARLDIRKTQDQLNIYGGNLEKGVLIIRAPFTGYIVSKNVVAGQQIEAGGDPLFSISDLKEVWVMANLYAGNLENVKEGMKVDIKASAYPGKIFTGKIDKLSNVFDVEERVLKARIRINNSDLRLKPEMFVRVSVDQPQDEHLLAIPAKAVIFSDQKYQALLYKSDCEFKIVTFQPVYQTASWVMVKTGVSEGDKVITENHLLIFNQIKNQQATH